MNNFKYTYLLKYLHVGWISFVSEINICNQIFGTITSFSQKLKKLKKKYSHNAHYKTWAVFSDITKMAVFSVLYSGCYTSISKRPALSTTSTLVIKDRMKKLLFFRFLLPVGIITIHFRNSNVQLFYYGNVWA